MGQGAGLAGRRVLVVEDEFLIALDVEDALRELGCEVVGPVATVAQALAVLADPAGCDLAVLDVRLAEGSTAPLAQALSRQGIPFVVLTGYDRSQLSEPALREAVLLGKPLQRKSLKLALAGLLAG
jgi:AmiR/NasT family two-component response regulator